jgi:multidrug efflux pump subunit AcrA (membrane-fusion protein)
MRHGSIISRGEALAILRNDLRKRALKEHAAELNNATAEERGEILAQIDRTIEREIRLRAARIEPDTLLH